MGSVFTHLVVCEQLYMYICMKHMAAVYYASDNVYSNSDC